MTLEWILGIVATACGGLNIYQFIFWKTERKKMKAEADSATTDADQKRLDLQQDQYDYLLSKLTQYQKDYFELSDKMQDEMKKHVILINQKCNEISELKSKLIYFKGLRCYRSDCSMRIKTNVKDVKEYNSAETAEQK